MNLSASSAKPADPTYFLEGVIHDKSEMADFEGPLSLILLLLSKNKIEIRDIKISEILDQYLEYLNAMEKLDLEIASEFVQMASYLLYIKTRMLLTEEKEVTELEQLIASLEQLKCKDTYAAVKSVTPMLDAAAQTGLHYLSRPPEPLPKSAGEYRYRIEQADLLRALLSVFTRGGAAATDALQMAAPKRIVYSVRDKCRTLIDQLRERGSMPLSTLYSQCTSRSEIVATFLSVLELCSLGHLMLSEQNGEYVASFTGGVTDDILESIIEREIFMEHEELLSVIEAILFAAGDPVLASRIALVTGEETQTIVSAARELAAAYEENRCGMRLVQMNDLLQLCSAPEYAEYIRRALEQRKPPKLSQPALEVLAIVAYFQPVTRAYIDQVRGVDSAYTVTTLLERGLIEACGKLDAPGRPSLYRTSALFLRTMGMQSLDELPVLPDLSSDEGAEKLEQAISELRGRGEQMELTDTEEKPTGE